MEALLEKEGTVESCNDERLDELSRRMDAGFEKVDASLEKAATKVELAGLKNEMTLRFREVDRRFDEVTFGIRSLGERFDRLQNTLMIGLIGVITAIVANGIWG
ncbi:MAG: hypothetical protein ACTHKT_05860 [Solirubrobacterales bacterium]